jgi:hypothetical protein
MNGTAKPTNSPKSPGHATNLSLQDYFPVPEALPNKGLTQPYCPLSSTYGMAVKQVGKSSFSLAISVKDLAMRITQ